MTINDLIHRMTERGRGQLSVLVSEIDPEGELEGSVWSVKYEYGRIAPDRPDYAGVTVGDGFTLEEALTEVAENLDDAWETVA